MKQTLLGISPEYLYFHGEKPKKVSDFHRPYFLAFCSSKKNIENIRNDIINKWKKSSSDEDILYKIEKIGDIENYRSFWNFNKNRKIFKVYTKKSYYVPEVSDHLFFNFNLFTAEHDIPYQQRSLVDIEATGLSWIFDTKGECKKLKVLVYDIETIQYEMGKKNVPIDIIGYADFNLSYKSEKDLESEDFSFEIIDCPSNWENIEVTQLVSKNIDEEIDNIYDFCKTCINHDIISGHNIIGFDNVQIYDRLNWILKTKQDNLSNEKRTRFQDFLAKFSRIDKSFHFGIHSEVIQFYPCNLDTYLGARKFYSFLDEFSLKSVAPFLGVNIENRLVLTPSQIRIDNRTLKYNKHDVQEQIGVTLNLIQQVLPLAFTTGMTFDMLLSSGAVNMWDHMSLIRGAVQKKIMPPICRVMSISQTLSRYFKECKTMNEIIKKTYEIKEQLSKEFIRVIKYGDEMPYWVEDPYVIYNEGERDPEDRLNYHIPGGMTIKPDRDANSHFIPWWHVVVADVGAMYPTILKAMNIGADTVRLAFKTEKPDAWIWLKKIPFKFLKNRHILWKEISENDSYADIGFMLGVKINNKSGVVNCAMTGIMSMIAKIKNELRDAENKGDKELIKQLKMMYQSLKGARNAGTHGILCAPNVSGRQFNLWGAAAITTKGQMILADTLNYLKKKQIRVVYGDTDGIYIGCSRSSGNLPEFSKLLNIKISKDEDAWITKPVVALNSIKECNKKWQNELNYPDFELETEINDGMIFVKHKNYLIFNNRNGKIEMDTKGNNFKGSDKANIAKIILEKIMINVLNENPNWINENEARRAIKNSIKNNTKKILSKIDLSKVDLNDLTLVQSVQPARRYKTNMDGSISTFGKRAKALEDLLGKPITNRMKFKFVVTKKPLPGISKPSKSSVKPIDYMYPINLLKDKNDVDLNWYKKMIENYVQGAFGLSNIIFTEQRGLDSWM